MSKIEELVSQKVREFLMLAEKYCQSIEEASPTARNAFMNSLLHLLPKIYLRAITLPLVEVMYSAVEKQFLSEKSIREIRRKISQLTASHDVYASMGLDALKKHPILTSESMAESLTDLYLVLKNFILWYKEGSLESMNDSIIVCFSQFRLRWGTQLIDLMRHLHGIQYPPAQPVPSFDVPDEVSEEGTFDPSETEGFSEERES